MHVVLQLDNGVQLGATVRPTDRQACERAPAVCIENRLRERIEVREFSWNMQCVMVCYD
jgi:hypothetical protein